ncbi:MAG: glycosyltransferase family 39 protein [Chloroflexota bacterium]
MVVVDGASTARVEIRRGFVPRAVLLEIVAVLSLTLGAGLLRFYRLGDWSLWRDEIYTMRAARVLSEIAFEHPVWHVLTHFSIAPLGISEWSLRLPAAIVGTVAIPCTYALVRGVWGRLPALLTALLLALSPWHLYWSQNARFYILVSLLTTVAIFLFYRALEEDRTWLLIASLLLFGVAVLTHPTALLSLGAALAYLFALACLPGSRPKGFNSRHLGILGVLAAAPVLFILWRIATKPFMWEQYLQLVNNDSLWLVSVIVYYLGVPLVCLATFGAAYALWQRDRLAIMLTLAAVVPVLAILMISGFSYSASRYMFAAAVPIVILAARGVSDLLTGLRANAVWLGLGVVAILAAESLSEDALYYQYQHGNRFNYRAAFGYVQARAQPDELVLSTAPEVGKFYLKGRSEQSMLIGDLRSVEEHGQRAWIVVDEPLTAIKPTTAEWLRKHTVLAANYDVHVRARVFVAQVYLYTPPGLK